ncbi:uncharacterized protein LOC142977972 isoform X2 [Anticarsia gemmatalis]|uniref:uncharacterized protein LOC142977972 isoform X2 n=1 Tax=Anticarsia gemmatalis TaxID=129554 RepID=UPI003F75F3A3
MVVSVSAVSAAPGRCRHGGLRVVHTCVAGRGAVQRGRAGVRTPRAADMDLRLTRPRKRVAGAGARAVFTCGCRRRVQRAGDRSLGGAGAAPGGGGRGERAPAASPPRGRVRAVVACPVVRRAGVSPRAPGGGGEPRAARPRADVAAARSRSAPSPPPPGPCAPDRRRARSLVAKLAALAPPSAHPAPRLRPVFLWARQSDGTVQEVRCEDYDPRNRIRIARTPTGWRVIPRTEIFDSIRVPARDKPERVERRRRRRPGRPRRRRADASAPAPAWNQPDLESHIPQHTIEVPRGTPPPPAEPTPLDSLLAVAEIEFNQQRGEEALELDLHTGTAEQYPFLPEAEDVARDVMSFELGEPKQPDEIFFERKSHPPERPSEEDAFQSEMAHVHKDLFETISEAHYLPELGGPHDEALLESLVEKGCEDNQILGQALDKLAHLVHGSGDYAEEEDDMLLGGAPVADIIDRLEQSLESPSRSSMTAAQGLLHLHHIGDHLPPPEHEQAVEPTFMPDEVFAPSEVQPDCSLETLTTATEMQQANEVNQLEYEQSAEKRLKSDVDSTDAMFTEHVPDLQEAFDVQVSKGDKSPLLSDQTEETLTTDATSDETTDNDTDNIIPKVEAEDSNEETLAEKDSGTEGVELVATDLSKKTGEKKGKTKAVVASDAETTNSMEESIPDRSEESFPIRDINMHRRLPTPHASPRRIDIPRAPSRESDAMQSPQPSGIPAVPSSPEIFTMPHTKSKQSLFLETLLSSPSPKMYTSEVTISKQQCEPLNLGKHRKSASPTVTSCSDEIRKLNKEFGEPQEKKRRESSDDSPKLVKLFNRCESNQEEPLDIKPEIQKLHTKPPKQQKLKEELSPHKQFQLLKSSPTFNIPDPLLVPKDKVETIVAAPAREIPLLLMQRPELRLPEAFAYPIVLGDPDIIVLSLKQLEELIINHENKEASKAMKGGSNTEHANTSQLEQTNQLKMPSVESMGLGDFEAATSAAISSMFWLPYISQVEAVAACSQNAEFIKALTSAGYNPNYPDISPLLNPASRMGIPPAGFPMVPPMEYDSRVQFAMWQEAMNNANAAQRAKAAAAMEAQMKEMAAKSSDVQNPYVHSTKNHQSKSHSSMSARSSPITMSSRSSPIASNYNAATAAAVAAGQRAAALQHNPFLQNMYPAMNPNIRPNVPLSGLQIPPYYNANLMGRDQRSPRSSSQQKSPTSPFYPNNNYLQSLQSKQAEAHPARSSSTGSHQSTESPRPRISVKSLHNLLEPTAAAAAASVSRRSSGASSGSHGRRRDEPPEVGSTTPLGEPPLMPPHPHDPASFHLWHPLFGK